MFSKALQVSNHLGYRGVCNLGSMNSLCPVLYTKIWHLQATRNDSFFFFSLVGEVKVYLQSMLPIPLYL